MAIVFWKIYETVANIKIYYIIRFYIFTLYNTFYILL